MTRGSSMRGAFPGLHRDDQSAAQTVEQVHAEILSGASAEFAIGEQQRSSGGLILGGRDCGVRNDGEHPAANALAQSPRPRRLRRIATDGRQLHRRHRSPGERRERVDPALGQMPKSRTAKRDRGEGGEPFARRSRRCKTRAQRAQRRREKSYARCALRAGRIVTGVLRAHQSASASRDAKTRCPRRRRDSPTRRSVRAAARSSRA